MVQVAGSTYYVINGLVLLLMYYYSIYYVMLVSFLIQPEPTSFLGAVRAGVPSEYPNSVCDKQDLT